jgi:putative peptidoglycan lipid II flippase
VALLTITSFVAMGAGFLREATVAYFFGTTGDADVFALAMFYVDGISAVVISGLAGYLMVPVVTKVVHEKGAEEGFRLMETCLVWITLLAAPLVALALWRMDFVVTTIAPGFDPARRATLAHLLLFALPACCTILMGGVMSGVLQARRDYYSPVHGRTLFSLATALVLLFAAERLGIEAAGTGLLVGGVLLLAMQLRGLRRLGWRPQVPRLHHDALAHAVRAGIPILVALLLINVLMGGAQRVAASGLSAGAFSAVNYAQRSLTLVSGLSLSLATVSLTELSVQFGADGVSERTLALLRETLESGVWMLVPLSVLLLAACEPLVALLFHRGRYDADSVRLTASCLRWLTLSVVPGMVLAVLHRAAPAFGRPWRSTITSTIWAITTVGFTIVALPRLGAEALAAGFAAGTLVAAIASVGVLHDLVPLRFYAPVLQYAGRIALLTSLGLLVTLGVLWLLGPATTFSLTENVRRLLAIGIAFLGTTLLGGLISGERRTRAALGAVMRQGRALIM